MSEVPTRSSAPRGRGSRGGRGGYGPRGGARGGSRHATNGDKLTSPSISAFEEGGEIGELKKKYAGQLKMMQELFPDWTDEDIVYALQETDGDLEGTIDRITEGNVSQWGEVKKKTKDRSRSKVKDPVSTSTTETSAVPSGRGARGGKGSVEGGRGNRSRGSERSRGTSRVARGGSVAPTNGTRSAKDPSGSAVESTKISIPTDESSVWGTKASKQDADATAAGWDANAITDNPSTDAWADTTVSNTAPSAESRAPKSSVISGDAKKSWASMFAKPAPSLVAKKPPPPPPPITQQISNDSLDTQPTGSETRPTTLNDMSLDKTPSATPAPSETESNLTPSKDELTETNLEQVLDTSVPPATATAASTAASSRDPRSGAESTTPYSSVTQLPTSRPPLSGFATTAYKATGAPGRTSSFQRRVLDQQEALVMPGNHAVDRTAVQFGSMGLNGSSDDQDVDEDREEAETRAQPPQHSPVAHPVASLPPATQSHSLPAQPSTATDAEPTPRQAPGLPAVPQKLDSMNLPQSSTQPPVGPQSAAQQASQSNNQYGQFNRYAQQPAQQDHSSLGHKAYDPFNQHTSQLQTHQNQYDPYANQGHGQDGHTQHQQQPQLGTFSSAPSEYSSYYTSDQQQRSGYGNYYGSQYGQQSAQSPQDAGATQQRASSGFGHAVTDSSSQYPMSQAQQPPSRYAQAGETQGSGQTTPSIPAHQPHQSTQPQQSQHMQQQQQQQQPQGQAGGHGGYPYNHPYYSNPYYNNYMNQYGYGQGYGAPFGGKGGMYGQPHQGYGISPQSSYEHSSSPANIGGFSQPSLHGRDSALSGSVNEYGRSGSTQASQGQQQPGAGSSFSGMSDVFGRSGFQGQGQSQGQGQTQPVGQHHSSSQAGGEETLKAFGDSKASSGPSPSLGQPGRPGSTTNATPGGQGFPSQGQGQGQGQQSQQGFSGYPSHLNHHLQGGQGSGQYSGLGGLGGHQGGGGGGGQSHQGSGGYGNYGAGFGGSYYGSGGGRGGWGGNYGH
ncbi:MAG: hypothetical protein M1837_003554 [Sclerophora amabilis]|nr:MAG: hypothetical protein M1837_003554 [Sclerophora amabilis]